MTNTADLLEQIPDLGRASKIQRTASLKASDGCTMAQPQPCRGQEDPKLLRPDPLWPGCLLSFPLSSKTLGGLPPARDVEYGRCAFRCVWLDHCGVWSVFVCFLAWWYDWGPHMAGTIEPPHPLRLWHSAWHIVGPL